MKSITFHLAVTIVAAFAAGCAGNPNNSLADQCHNGLNAAYSELDYAKTIGLEGTIEYTKAASLLGAAKIQYEFGKYPNCIDKVNRARTFIARSKSTGS